MRRFYLTHHRAPGDIVTMTALVRDLKRAYPDVEIGVGTSAMDLWKHNPYLSESLTMVSDKRDVKVLKLDYGPGIREHKTETIHFMAYWHRVFQRATGLKVPVTEPKPDLHFGPDEQARPISGRYWVIIAGGKSDFPVKVWYRNHYQTVCDGLRNMGLGVVQCGSNDPRHWHMPLEGALNLVGKTNLRDLMRIIKHADGVICGITLAAHVAAALERPCVVVAGGREAFYWEGYYRENRGLVCPEKLRVPHRYLHTIGLLPCCEVQACWRNKVVPLGNDKDRSLCKMPIALPGQTIPKCLEMITPAHVLAAVTSYYTDNSLPPISLTPPTVLGLPAAAPSQRPPSAPSLWDVFDDPPTTAPSQRPPSAPPLSVPPTPELILPLVGRGKDHVAAATAPVPRNQAMPVRKGTRPHPQKKPTVGGPRLANLPNLPGHPADDSILNHPLIGGKVTIFVLLYSDRETGQDYHRMHRECLGAILATVPPQRLDLRIGSNTLCQATHHWIDELIAAGRVTKHYPHATNARKYPVMREMFYDPDCPITTPYLIWFDDDSLCSVNPRWLTILAQTIVDKHGQGYRMFGPRKVFQLNPEQIRWVKQGRWYRGRPLQDKAGRPAPNGNKVHFAVGAFWALHTEAMRQCDIPDERIGHNLGDVISCGAQLWQHGFDVQNFSLKKDIVNWSCYSRRGLTEKAPLRPA